MRSPARTERSGKHGNHVRMPSRGNVQYVNNQKHMDEVGEENECRGRGMRQIGKEVHLAMSE